MKLPFLKISPTVQLSIGLVLLTVSILIVAQAIGLAPGIKDNDRIYAREKLAETIALQTTIALKRDDRLFLESMFQQVVNNTPEIKSLALRRNDASIAYQTESHEKLWSPLKKGKSTATQIQLPINTEGMQRGMLEIQFDQLDSDEEKIFGRSKTFWLIVFVCGGGFIAFYIYLKRVLRHLDPSNVVPARVRNALNTMAEGVLVLDKRGHIVLANEALVSKLNTQEDKLIGVRADDIGLINEHSNTPEHFPWNRAQSTNHKQMKTRMRLEFGDNRRISFSVNSVPILDERGRSQGTINSFDDVTEIEEKNALVAKMLKNLVEKQNDIEQKNKELHHLATRDALTDCYNRRYLFDALNDVFSRQEGAQSEFGVIMLDIDKFKRINDTYGHGFGDDVIKAVANVIKKQTRKDDIVARFGGEEFCVLLSEITPERAFQVAEKCRKTIEASPVDGIIVTASFGVTSLSYGANSPNELIIQADQALYYSKEHGRNQCTTWTRNLALKAQAAEIESRTKRA